MGSPATARTSPIEFCKKRPTRGCCIADDTALGLPPRISACGEAHDFSLNTDSAEICSSAQFLAGGGEMGARMRAHDWAQTPLGDPRHWPQSLKTIVRVMLDSRYAMWMLWGPQLTFFCNDAYLPTVGLKRDWVLGARSDLVWQEIWPEIGPRIRHVLDTGEATWDEALQLFLERSGYVEETYHTFSYSPIYDDDSRIAGMLCVVTEVTDRIIGERHLRMLRDLAAQSVTVESVDQTCRRICQVLGRYPLDVAFGALYLIEGAAARRVAEIRELADEPLPASFNLDASAGPWPIQTLQSSEATQIVSDLPRMGLRIPAAVWPDLVQRSVMIPLKGAGAHALSGFLILGVSPRRAFDDAYRRFFELIATQVSAAIGDAQAYSAERQRAEALAELDRAKTVFFSNISHEFRTPLTLMLGPLEAALGSAPEELAAHRDDLQVAHRSALRLLKLVNSLLDFSRLENGRIQAQFEPVDLPAVTREISGAFESAVRQAGLQFHVRCDALPTPAFVDRDMWEKIVLNLLSNAFKYTFSGRIDVELSGTSERIDLRVTDTGIGIPPEFQSLLFERFYRVPGAQGRTHEGTGIGLSLVNELVKQHGGSIRVESRPGEGSCFTVTLPAGSSHLPEDRIAQPVRQPRAVMTSRAFIEEVQLWHPQQSRDPASVGSPDSADLPLVLLAEDNADMRAYIERLLAPRFRVASASDGHAALALLAKEQPSLILSDIMMPRLDGLALLHAVRSDPRWRELPVILLSARAGEEATIEGLEAQADDYIVKPFPARELIARVSSQIAMNRLRREAQRAVAESEERFRIALSCSRVGFTVLQAVRASSGAIVDFEWKYVNPSAERLLQQPSESLLGERVSRTVPRIWDASDMFETLVRVVQTGDAADLETPVSIREDVPAWFHHSIARMGDAAVVWSADITDRKSAEAELRDVSRRKDEFLAILAHELRNPLAPIRQAAAIAGAARATAAQQQWSRGVIERQVRHMARLLDDLLDVSRITRGTLELRQEWLEVQTVISAAIETAKPIIDAKGHTLTVRVDHELPSIHADALRLAQVLSNLLTNAAKYTDAGGHIRLTAECTERHLVLSVSDTGIGIEPEAIPLMFQMFSQLRPALQRSEGGLGIGLALVKGLIALHNGSVEVRSRGAGQGSEFRVHLPLPPARERPKSVDTLLAAAAYTDRRRRVLAVDDNVDAVESLSVLLGLDGHEVRSALTAEAGLEIATAFRPDVAILDIGMPGRNGYELARALRGQFGADCPLLVALTGWGQAEDRSRAREAGFDEHLTKPVDPSTVRELVRTLAGRDPPVCAPQHEPAV